MDYAGPHRPDLPGPVRVVFFGPHAAEVAQSPEVQAELASGAAKGRAVDTVARGQRSELGRRFNSTGSCADGGPCARDCGAGSRRRAPGRATSAQGLCAGGCVEQRQEADLDEHSVDLPFARGSHSSIGARPAASSRGTQRRQIPSGSGTFWLQASLSPELPFCPPVNFARNESPSYRLSWNSIDDEEAGRCCPVAGRSPQHAWTHPLSFAP